MRKFFSLMLLSALILLNLSLPPSFSDEGFYAPLSPAFLEWQRQFLSKDSDSESDTEFTSYIPNNKSLPEYSGHIPIPVDLSYLADNPPIEDSSPLESMHVFNNGATASDSEYDLRTYGYVTSVKNQTPYETCWAFSAIAAMESNFLRQGGSELDLSEMHLSYFTFNNATKSKAFDNITNDLYATMNHGGNSFYPAALYSRLDGPVLDAELPYSTSTPAYNTPESYTQALRLKDVYYLAMTSNPVTVNQSDAQRTVIKQRILDNGAVVANYYHDDDDYTSSSDVTAYYNTHTGSSNHAVLLIGWDDNFSRSNFAKDPGMDGAWLVKNSWGTNWENSGGYFWMSYANYLTEGSAYIVEQVNSDLKAYYYDALGWCSLWGYTTASVYAANAFKATRTGEKLIEIGFYTPDNNMSYEIYIRTGLGTSMPSSPAGGTLAATLTGTISHAGYHTVALDSPVSLTQNQYFSVIVKYTGQHWMPIECNVTGFSDNFACESGSFFSPNGTTWTAGTDKNATIKAFTTSSAGDTAPVFRTMSLPSGAPNTAYSALLSAYGKTPITWTLSSGNLPDGLALDSDTGIISGTPTSKDTYTFTITASNDLGTASKQFSIEITDIPAIATTSLTGYVGYTMNETLKLSSSTLSAVWSVDALPKKLTLDANTGVISGKPSKAGVYTLNVTATTSAGDSTATVTLTINEKPTKASISTSKLTQITIGSAVTDTLSYKGTEPVTFAFPDGLPDGLAFDSSTASFSGTPTKAGNFVIRATASNIVNTLTGKEPSVKKIKLVVKAQAPVIKDIEAFPDGIVGKEYTAYQVELSSGTSPDKWSASGLPKGLEINTSGEITGTPEKAGSFKVKITGKNNGGKDSTEKIPMNIYMVPEITTKKLKDGKTDKAYSVKLAAKGDPTSWDVTGLPNGLEQSLDKKGNVVIAGTPTAIGTSSVKITAENIAGSDDVTLSLTVKGAAPKIKASIPKGTVGSAYSGTITATGTKPLLIDCEILAADQTKHGIASLDELGLTFSADSSTGIATITGTPKYSVKGLPLQITVKNPMKSVTKKVSLKISGTKPSFTAPSGSSMTAAAGSSISMDFVASGSGKMTLTMKSVSGFTFRQTGANTGHLSGTVPSGKKVKLTVTAKNADGKATKKFEIQVSGNGAVSDTGALLYGEEQAESQEDSAEILEEQAGAETGTVSFGEARDSGSLTQSERDMLEREGYIVAAVLPEMSADVSGMYDLEAEISGDIPAGAEMVWLACPVDYEVSEDDEIAEFFDEDGQEITGVPESRRVSISVWLREGVTYRPVIAVKQ